MSRARKGMTSRDEPDPRLASELRQSVGREWADDVAEDERLTELMRRRRLTLSDMARDVQHQGARVSVEFAGHNFSGPLSRVGDDYATIEAPGQIVDVRFAVTTWAILRIADDKPAMPSEMITFKAHLHELSGTARRVGLAIPDGQILVGKIEVVAEDHVEIRDADDRGLLVPLELILATIRSSDPH